MKTLHVISIYLLIIGGLNWLLVGLFKWDIGLIFGGQGALVSRLVYILVGLSALVILMTHRNECSHCVSGAKTSN